jgi:hypothetical protein
LVHPLVSPALSYLGGLPPLMFIAGDKEVLRDEVIYTFVAFDLFVPLLHILTTSSSAHKAAYPEKYPISDRVRGIYPVLNGIETRCKPTPVHLQVYDGKSQLSGRVMLNH